MKWSNNPQINAAFEQWYQDWSHDPYWSSLASELPVVSAFYKARENRDYWDDYMANTGMHYRDVRYPTRVFYGDFGFPYSAAISIGRYSFRKRKSKMRRRKYRRY